MPRRRTHQNISSKAYPPWLAFRLPRSNSSASAVKTSLGARLSSIPLSARDHDINPWPADHSRRPARLRLPSQDSAAVTTTSRFRVGICAVEGLGTGPIAGQSGQSSAAEHRSDCHLHHRPRPRVPTSTPTQFLPRGLREPLGPFRSGGLFRGPTPTSVHSSVTNRDRELMPGDPERTGGRPRRPHLHSARRHSVDVWRAPQTLWTVWTKAQSRFRRWSPQSSPLRSVCGTTSAGPIAHRPGRAR